MTQWQTLEARRCHQIHTGVVSGDPGYVSTGSADTIECKREVLALPAIAPRNVTYQAATNAGMCATTQSGRDDERRRQEAGKGVTPDLSPRHDMSLRSTLRASPHPRRAHVDDARDLGKQGPGDLASASDFK